MRKMMEVGLLILLIATLFVGCKLSPDVVDAPIQEGGVSKTDEANMIDEYFPFLENTMLVYEGEGNEFASQDVYFEFIRGNRAQIKVMNPGTNILRVLELSDGSLSEIYHEGEFYHIEDLLDVMAEKQDIILKEPLERGTTWVSTDGYEKKITSLDAQIETPYGSLEALEVTTVFDQERLQKDYFVKGIGFVARVYKDGDTEIKTLLKEIRNIPMTQEMLVYYPLKDNSMEVVFIRDSLEFTTNANIEKILESKMKNPPDERLGLTLPPGAIINSVHLDRSSWVAKVDFNESFIRDLNVGSSYEAAVLNSIVNTIGKFYDTEEVYISMNGRPYESGHIAIQEGETFKVDLENIEEFK
ncbi:hypothetical protein E9840_06550 [Tissierella creatinini]|nr:hypothetical protein E9840_06550 [Tissierella creatinini]TJX67494.1 hypothetical protein E8P77_04995 [Soehngenia saccharolytica]